MQGERIFEPPLHRLFEQSDLAMINLEAPLCDPETRPDNPGGFGLRADPSIATYLKDVGIDVVGLANNHIRDFGDEGVYQTMRHLDAGAVLHVGAGDNLANAQKPLSIVVNGLKVGIWALAERELNVASDTSAGSSWFRPEQDVDRVAEFHDQYDFLVVFLHAGHEFIATPSPRIRKACRALVDAGADAIIAHHPHVVQGAERYNNALIAYSLGNLVFDSPYVSAYDDTDIGYMVRIVIARHAIRSAEIVPYRLRENAVVTALGRTELETFREKFSDLCENITDDPRFAQAWEDNVRFRWATEYGRILRDFSKHFVDVENKDYARRTRNLFTCPTHVEMLEKALSMLEEGTLDRCG